MRRINIANEKKRDAEVNMESRRMPKKVFLVLQDGSEQNNIKVLKTSIKTDLDALLSTHGDALSQALIDGDPEVDMELTGSILAGTSRIYLKKDNSVSYKVKMMEAVYLPSGEEKEVRPYIPKLQNVKTEEPLCWTGKKIAKDKAIKKYVFSKKYQLRHVNGLTYDFLFDIAKNLQESQCLMMMAPGESVKDPLIFQEGGTPYRGFLEGRIEGDKYCLLLHLTNLELKEINQ